MKVGTDRMMVGKPKGETSPAPPPPLPPPRFCARKISADSVTKREIAEFWRQKRIVEEDHLLAAIKAAARIRARNLTEEDYKRFEDTLNGEYSNAKEKSTSTTNSQGDENNWWRKSQYAYLNQPAGVDESMDNPKQRASSTYIPNCFNHKPAAPLYPTSLGVF